MDTQYSLTLAQCRDIVQQAWQRLGPRRLLVVGDVIVDEFVTGAIKGVSREAPVLVLHQQSQEYVPGGAANTANNAASLGAMVEILGVIGIDVPGSRVRGLLEAAGVTCDGMVVTTDRPTTTKTRISAASQQSVMQQIVCLDREDRAPLEASDHERLLEHLDRLVPAADAVIISDYKRGVVTQAVINRCLELARRAQKIVVVDSEGDLSRFRGATVITPNQPEVEQNLGRPIGSLQELEAAGRQLRQRVSAQALVITRGAAGMSLFEQSGEIVHIPVFNRSEVFDVTGAGDTVVATLALALSCALPTLEAMLLASLAASLVVKRFGTSTTTRAEMQEAAEALEVEAAAGTPVEAN